MERGWSVRTPAGTARGDLSDIDVNGFSTAQLRDQWRRRYFMAYFYLGPVPDGRNRDVVSAACICQARGGKPEFFSDGRHRRRPQVLIEIRPRQANPRSAHEFPLRLVIATTRSSNHRPNETTQFGRTCLKGPLSASIRMFAGNRMAAPTLIRFCRSAGERIRDKPNAQTSRTASGVRVRGCAMREAWRTASLMAPKKVSGARSMIRKLLA